jgi:hypothetical protein
MKDDPIISDVADAVTANEAVDWRRSATLVSAGHEDTLDNLRAVSTLLTRIQSGNEVLAARTSADLRPLGYAGVALVVLVVLSAVDVAAALIQMFTSPERTAGAAFPGFQLASVVCFTVCGMLLFVGGRYDLRTRIQGALFMLIASSFSLPFLQHSPTGVSVIAFIPALQWAFVRRFPRVQRVSWMETGSRGMTVLSIAAGAVLTVANTSGLESSFPALSRANSFGPFWLIFGGLSLLALLFLPLRIPAADGNERRRVVVFVSGLVLGAGPMLSTITLEALSPRYEAFVTANEGFVVSVVFASLLSIPFSMTYAVMAQHVLDLRLVLRATYKRLLGRRFLVAAALAPAVGLFWMLASQPERTVGGVLADYPTRILLLSTLGGGGVLLFRRPILVRFDSWVWPEAADRQSLLAQASAKLTQAQRVADVAEALVLAAERGCSAPAAMLLGSGARDELSLAFTPLAGQVSPLHGDTAIVFVLTSTRQPLVVDADLRRSAYSLLPNADALWVRQNNVAAIALVTGRGADVRGLLTLERRTDDHAVTKDDLTYLDALAAAGGLALEGMLAHDADSSRASASAPARFCRRCDALAGPTGDTRCDCGVEYEEAPVPYLVSGKIQIERKLGAGGMGVVFLGHDLSLRRLVAVKTLPEASVDGLVRLQEEARSMASISHPSIAQIHSLESWRGRPLLVVEYLVGGTLRARLDHKRLEIAEALRIGLALSDVLGELHEAGYVHRDVKPSNIGFAADDAVKILDFGLSQLVADCSGLAGGTLRYMSPNAIDGNDPSPEDDLWSLGVVLYEMVVGQTPFAGASAEEVSRSILRRQTSSVDGLPPRERSIVNILLESVLSGPGQRMTRASDFATLIKRIDSATEVDAAFT